MPKPEIIQHEIPADGDWDGSMLVCVPVVVKAPTEEATRAAAVKFIADFTRAVDSNRFVRALSDIPAYTAMGQVRAKIAERLRQEVRRAS